MKLSLVKIGTLTLATAALAIGCSVSTEEKKTDAPKPTEPAVVGPNEAAPVRKLVDGPALASSPVNLLADPGFSLVGRENGYGSFLAFYESGSKGYTLESTYDSRSPAGFGGSIALIKPAGATNQKTKAVTLLTSFLGGKGPFHAKLWVSKSDVDGAPVDTPTDGSAVSASIADGSPESNDAFDLKVDPNATRVTNGRTWVLLRADIDKPLDKGGFFVIRTGTTGGHFQLAAPEVTSDELVVGQAVLSKSALVAAVARVKTPTEKLAIKAYQSMPPRLMPAAPRPHAGE